ncbi:MAG TPA: hypothetical protein VH500_10385 [Nitrososphaeraceae archaeon]
MPGPKSKTKLDARGGDVNLFGYDTLVKEEIFTELHGEGHPTLLKGMRVILKGDSQGYIHDHFQIEERVTIIEFRQAFDNGSEDNVIFVTNGRKLGYVKPFNIKEIIQY